MLILSVDSTASPASACLYDGDKIIAEYYLNAGFTHSQTLMAMVESLLRISGHQPDEIDFFAVNNGPGSFTGVRIGVSAVKGMAYTAQKPCVGVSTLESMAYNFLHDECVVCACMDARRKQVYNALFRVKNGAVERLCDDRAIPIEELLSDLAQYKEKIIIAGDGAELTFNSCSGLSHVYLAPANLRYQRASSTALIAHQSAMRGEVVSSSALMPTYLRLSQAERELQSKQKEMSK